MTEYQEYREKKNHGKADFPFDIYACVIPDEIPEVLSHWHDEVELIYIRSGKGIICVDGESREMCGPALAVVFPGRLHSIRRVPGERLSYRNIMFHPDLLYSRNGEAADWGYLRPLFEGELCVPTFLDGSFPEFWALLGPLEACGDRGNSLEEGYPLLVKSQLYLLCYHLLRLFPEAAQNERRREAYHRIKPILSYLMEHYAENVTVADAARTAGFSEAHFMRFFRETTGETFVNYLRSYRLARAEEMIRMSEDSILSIAENCGFHNLSYFIRSFRKKYGSTPLQYRKERGALPKADQRMF